MAIIIPMAGLSNRFLNAGFSLPKYMLYIGNKSVFRLSIESFYNYFNKEQIIFICRNIYNTVEFIESECKIMGLNMYNVVT
jgi:UTP-glucose-1-phosphate uridylyltransferase